MDKIDFKKKHKQIYNPKDVSVISVPKLNYISLSGKGNPNDEEFSVAIGALYATAYAISMSYKGGFDIDGFYQFVVPPLEGVWDTADGNVYDGNKDNLKWDIMIMMPEFVTKDVLEKAKQIAFDKKKNVRIHDIGLESYTETKACVYKHVGSYDNEPVSFKYMAEYVETTEYKRKEHVHREIYLNDFRKIPKEKLKTILFFEVCEK